LHEVLAKGRKLYEKTLKNTKLNGNNSFVLTGIQKHGWLKAI
jgi:hypothetical protein